MEADEDGLIARNVRLRMDAKGFGAKALSLKAGLNETYVRDLLKGRSRNPRQAHLQSLALALDCLVSDLTGERESTENAVDRADQARSDLMAAFDAMDEQQRRALLVVAEGMVRREPPADEPAPPPKRRAAGCVVSVPRIKDRRA